IPESASSARRAAAPRKRWILRSMPYQAKLQELPACPAAQVWAAALQMMEAESTATRAARQEIVVSRKTSETDQSRRTIRRASRKVYSSCLPIAQQVRLAHACVAGL